MEELFQILAATVAAISARIGDGLSTWHDGSISAVDASAKAAGVETGMPAKEAAERILRFRR